VTPVVRNVGYLCALSLLWGSMFLYFKLAVESIPPLTVAAGRMVVGAAVLLPIVWARRQRLPRSPRAWHLFAANAVFGWVLPSSLIAWSERWIESTRAAIITGAVPIFTVVVAHLFTHDERLRWRTGVGVLIGFGGVVLLTGPEAVLGLSRGAWGQLALIAAAISFAFSNVLARRLEDWPATVSNAGVIIAATAILVPASLAVEAPWTVEPTWSALAGVAALGVLSTAIGGVMFFRLAAATGAVFVSMVSYLVPVVGVVLGVLALGEGLNWTALAALLLILLGVAATGVGLKRGTGRRSDARGETA